MRTLQVKAKPGARVSALTEQPDGSLWLDGERHTPGSLRAALRAVDIGRVKSAIVATDKGVPLQGAVDVIDLLNARGLASVALREARQFK